jgi:hypothetical protein
MMPYNETDAPKRAMLRSDIALPKAMKSSKETEEAMRVTP